MRSLTFTIYRSVTDIEGHPSTYPWEKWIQFLSEHETRNNKDGPAIVFANIPKDKTRLDKNVKEIHALCIDVDNSSDEEIEKALENISSFEFFIWTTFSHTKEKSKIRIVLPLKEPITPTQFKKAWLALNFLVNSINDPNTKNPSRLNFLPSTSNPDDKWVYHNSGKWISLSDLASNGKDLDFVINSLHRLPANNEIKPKVQQLLKGEPFAEKGERHNTILSLTFLLAQKNKSLSRQIVEKLFNPSLQEMKHPVFDEVWTAYQGAINKLETQASDFESHGQGKYSTEELETIAKAQGLTIDRLVKRWVIQSIGGGWFLTSTGEYEGPYSKDDMASCLSEYLARAPIRLVNVTQKGFTYRPISDVLRECGTVAKSIVSDLTAQKTRFDPKTKTLYEAILPLRSIEPVFHKQIDKWLEIAGGPLYSKIVDWLACCPDLEKLLCAIYLDGPASSGKTLLAVGLAKLWTTGPPADIERVISNFNDELVRCPLILADEEIPRRYQQNVTATLRTMLSTTSRSLKRKYKPTSALHGAVRLILAANNEFLLSSKDTTSAQDLEAIAQRFLYIPITNKATDYLESISRGTKEYWGDEGIAQHTMWLYENHKVEHPGKRFWVEGDVSQMHRMLITGSLWTSMVCEWLVRYLINPKPQDSKQDGMIRVYEGELLVSDQGVIDGWKLYMDHTKYECETSKIGAALRAISKDSTRRQLRWKGKPTRYRTIDIDHLVSWSDQHNIGDKATIVKFITEGAEVVKLPVEKVK